jgi:hypothetical protein
MRTVIAYAAGVLGSAALPVAFLMFLWVTSDHPFNRYSLGYIAWSSFLVLAVAAAVAIPTLLILHLLRAIRWLWLGVVGYFAGLALYESYLLATRDQPFAFQMTPTGNVVASMVGGVIGWICASACWFTIDILMRPNTSLERTRGK